MDQHFDFAGERCVPLPSGALWLPLRELLLVADLHLEKASFYATTGQMLPPYDSRETLARLSDDLVASRVQQVICLGDSFHDPGAFARLHDETRDTLAKLTSSIDWLWITGNHDPRVAEDLGGRSMVEIERFGIHLRHESRGSEGRPEISGHFHPKVRLTARGRTLSRRCFLLAANRLVLPSYGALTGGLDIRSDAITSALGRELTAIVTTSSGFARIAVNG